MTITAASMKKNNTKFVSSARELMSPAVTCAPKMCDDGNKNAITVNNAGSR